MRWTFRPGSQCREDERVEAYGEVVRSRSPDAVDQALRDERKATVARQARTPRRSRISRKAIAQGVPVVPAALSLLACAKVHFFCTQGSRVRPASGIPCALSIERDMNNAELGHDPAAGTRTRSPHERSDIPDHCPRVSLRSCGLRHPHTTVATGGAPRIMRVGGSGHSASRRIKSAGQTIRPDRIQGRPYNKVQRTPAHNDGCRRKRTGAFS